MEIAPASGNEKRRKKQKEKNRTKQNFGVKERKMIVPSSWSKTKENHKEVLCQSLFPQSTPADLKCLSSQVPAPEPDAPRQANGPPHHKAWERLHQLLPYCGPEAVSLSMSSFLRLLQPCGSPRDKPCWLVLISQVQVLKVGSAQSGVQTLCFSERISRF